MPFFKCAVCAEKDKRLADLKECIASLNSLLKVQATGPVYAHSVALEASRALDGQGVPNVDLPSEQKEHLEAVELQAVQLLTGHY